jgi:hypothetical protein
MKKVMLGLVMVVMLMSLVGCGETTKNEKENVTVENVTNSEVKEEVVNGLTGEKETVVQKEEVTTTIELYAQVVRVVERDGIDDVTVYFECTLNDEIFKFSQRYPKGTFAENDIIKFVMGTLDKVGTPDVSNIISWEIVEE